MLLGSHIGKGGVKTHRKIIICRLRALTIHPLLPIIPTVPTSHNPSLSSRSPAIAGLLPLYPLPTYPQQKGGPIIEFKAITLRSHNSKSCNSRSSEQFVSSALSNHPTWDAGSPALRMETKCNRINHAFCKCRHNLRVVSASWHDN